MKSGILVTLLLLNLVYNARGQDSLNYRGRPFMTHDLSTKIRKTKPPLFIVQSGQRIFHISANNRKVRKIFKPFHTDWIESSEILKGADAIKKYGSSGNNGVIIFKLKEGTLDKLPRKLKRYEVEQNFQKMIARLKRAYENN